MAATGDVTSQLFSVDEGAEVSVATGWHDWKTSWTVVAIDHVDWRGAGDEAVFRTRDLELETPQGSAYRVQAVDGSDDVQLLDQSGEKKGHLEQFEPFEATTHGCQDCGSAFDSGRGLAAHRNNPHTDCGPGAEGDVEGADGIVETFGELELGDRIEITTSWHDYASPLYVQTVDEDPDEPLPSGAVPDRVVTIQQDAGPTPEYDLALDGDDVVAYSEADVSRNQYFDGDGYREIGTVKKLEIAGEVSTSKRLELLGRQERDSEEPSGDDTWQDYYNRGEQ